MLISRRIAPFIARDLNKKMVLLSGPRQAGKTTIAQSLPGFNSQSYFSWDSPAHRKLLQTGVLPEYSRLWVFDELHKFSKWRNWLKGTYDLHHKEHSILVTGSAKLSVYSRGGDSLQGRYFTHRLHPLTLSEVLEIPTTRYDQVMTKFQPREESSSAKKKLTDLLRLGGFPEPFIGGSEEEMKRWRLSYGERIIHEEVRSLEQVIEIDRLELLYDRLGEVVGSNLTINRLAKDLEVAHQTVSKWLQMFNRLYVCFQVPPFGPPNIRAVKKEQKIYLWDWSRVDLPGAKLENLVAFHLLRLVDWFADIYGEKLELRYFRDVDGHEVDFVILKNRKPELAIEVKSSEQPLDRNLKYFLERQKVSQAFQLHLKGDADYKVESINGCKIRIMPLHKFLIALP